jgi:hypothetical protein
MSRPPTLSPDGKYWWDGQRWQLYAPPRTRRRLPANIGSCLGCLLILVVLAGILAMLLFLFGDFIHSAGGRG